MDRTCAVSYRIACLDGDWHARIEQSSTDAERLRHITDYLAGMTDDYADMMFEKAIHSAL
jgi:dGTP triphosphohydrolase